MSLLGKTIKLKGLSQKGKNRVRENGDRWMVLAETDAVLFAPHQHGPWVFIVPIGCDQDHKAGRWVRASDDDNFAIITLND